LSICATLLPPETPRLAERLVANLIDNALHYNHEHGHIDVATTTGHGRVQLSVRNSGLLIAQDQVEQLFRPFGVLFVVGCAVISSLLCAWGLMFGSLYAEPADTGLTEAVNPL
jgi:hypothetical protein